MGDWNDTLGSAAAKLRGPVADRGGTEGLASSFRSGQLDGEVADGGAFGVADIDGESGALLGELSEELVAAGAAEDVNAGELAAEHLLEAGKGGGIPGGEALKDQAGEERFVAGNIGDVFVA